jgi:hypothetical protein
MKTCEVRADSSMMLLEKGKSAFVEGGRKGRDARHVGGVEELDGVSAALATEAVALDRNLDTETLEVNNEGEDSDGRDEVHDVGQPLTVERLLERARLVVPGEEEVEERDDGALEFGSTTGVDGGRGESLPDNRLADVGGDEEVDTRTETVTLLEELVEKDDDESGDVELENEEEADTGSEVGRLAVETSKDVDGGGSERDEEGEDCKKKKRKYRSTASPLVSEMKRRTFLGSTEESAVLLERKVNLDETGTLKKLDDHAGSDDGGDTEFHESTTVRGEDDTHPVERVCDAKRGLAALEEGEKGEEENAPEESEETIPYSGIWEQTRKMSRVTAVHPTCDQGKGREGGGQRVTLFRSCEKDGVVVSCSRGAGWRWNGPWC